MVPFFDKARKPPFSSGSCLIFTSLKPDVGTWLISVSVFLDLGVDNLLFLLVGSSFTKVEIPQVLQ